MATKKKTSAKSTASADETQTQEGDTGLQTPLPDQPIETPDPEPTPEEQPQEEQPEDSAQHGVTGLENLQPDEQSQQPQVEEESATQRSQILDTRNRVQSLGENQLSEHERQQAELAEQRRVHNERVGDISLTDTQRGRKVG